jgi:serine/threonine protein kinase
VETKSHAKSKSDAMFAESNAKLGAEADSQSEAGFDAGFDAESDWRLVESWRIVNKEMQVAKISYFEAGTVKRGLLRAARVSIIENGQKAQNPFQKSLCMADGTGNGKSIRLFGAYAWRVSGLSSRPDDLQPSFAENSVCIRLRGTNHGVILSSPTAKDAANLLDSLCRAGCIVSDLKDHFKVLPSSAKLPPTVRLGRPTTRRSATHANTVAAKIASDEKKIKELTNEVQFLLSLNHGGIVRAYGLYSVTHRGEMSLAMLLDYKQDGELKSFIPDGGLPERTVRGILAQLCCAVEYIHAFPVVHRDIKPSNVLCERREDGSLKVFLADFGFATHVMDTKKMSVRCGTAGFAAPEIFHEDWETEVRTESITGLTKIDMFSLGMVMYSTAFGDNPFVVPESVDATFRRNSRGLLSFKNMPGRSDEFKSLLSGLCATDPRRRLSSSEALAHPWILDRGLS